MSDANKPIAMSNSKSTICLNGQNLSVQGNLVFPTVAGLLDKSHSLFQENKPDTIIIDLSGVDHIDSAGIALLVEWQRYCLKQHITCQFIGFKQQAVSLAKTYKLLEILQNH